jgi:hypothetical protein
MRTFGRDRGDIHPHRSATLILRLWPCARSHSSKRYGPPPPHASPREDEMHGLSWAVAPPSARTGLRSGRARRGVARDQRNPSRLVPPCSKNDRELRLQAMRTTASPAENGSGATRCARATDDETALPSSQDHPPPWPSRLGRCGWRTCRRFRAATASVGVAARRPLAETELTAPCASQFVRGAEGYAPPWATSRHLSSLPSSSRSSRR